MQRAGEFYVSRDDLLQAGLPAERLSQGEINVSRLPQVTTQYDSSGQRLLLSVPQDWLPERATPFGGEARVNEARNGRGALLDYDFCSSHSQNGDSQASIWHELRFFNDVGSLSSTGYVRHILAGDGERQQSPELRNLQSEHHQPMGQRRHGALDQQRFILHQQRWSAANLQLHRRRVTQPVHASRRDLHRHGGGGYRLLSWISLSQT